MQQRVINPSQGKANDAGSVTLSFQGPPSGLAWVGTVAVPNADLGSSWQIYYNAITSFPIGSTLGRTPFGPIYLDAAEHLVIVGTGLTPASNYTGVFMGVSDDSDSLPLVSPDANASSLSLDILVAQVVQAGEFDGGTFTGAFVGNLTGNADTATTAGNAVDLAGQPASFYATASGLNTEATNRANADNALAAAVGATLQNGGASNPVLGGSPAAPFAWQAGSPVISATAGSTFAIPLPNSFTHGLLTAVLTNEDIAVGAYTFHLDPGSMGSPPIGTLRGLITPAVGTGTLIRIGYIAIGW